MVESFARLVELEETVADVAVYRRDDLRSASSATDNITLFTYRTSTHVNVRWRTSVYVDVRYCPSVDVRYKASNVNVYVDVRCERVLRLQTIKSRFVV